ncbi:MAG: sugar-binding protein, partial [Armatimonadota bacterium]
GTMEALYNNYPSWETQYYTAWYQLQGGAPGFVFEGRYVKRGYGWNPEALLGSGLEDLDDKQQFDYFHAFLRGAARRWGGYWGTSVYPEGDKSMMIPALKRAYDQGARCLWFWNDRDLPYKFRLEVLKALNEHVKCHPSRNCDKASTAIVLPSGYMLTEDGIWGVRREQINSFGINYGDIAATALFEGILLSREGIEFDYVNDHPEIGKAGYKQLIYIRENGQTQWVPKKNHKNKPINLSLSVKRVENTYTPPDKAPQYEVRRASNISVDGNLDDWTKARWIEMNGQPYHFGDNYELDLTLTVPSDVNEKSDQKCLGFTWDQINEEYRQRYLLEGYGSDQVVVTSIISGGAAERAGLREGDIILRFGEKRIRWAFEVWGMVDWCKRRPSTNIDIRIQRNGTDRLEGSTDLSARFAFLVDDDNLYIALDVTDDVHYQMMHGADLWMNDSVQIGIDPTNARTTGYGENGHEFGLALCNGKDVVWRWSGRRGQPENAIKTAQTKIVRRGYHTIYEAKVPLHELTPLAPDMWHQAGICVVVNDSDGTPYRKARLELSPGAMTRGKNLAMFPLFEFEPSLNHKKVSAALFWLKRCMKPEGAAQLLICTSSPATEKAIIKCKLSSLDDPDSRPLTAKTYIDLTSEVSSYLLSVHTSSNPGRYKLAVEITDPTGRVSANDSLPIYIYK